MALTKPAPPFPRIPWPIQQTHSRLPKTGVLDKKKDLIEPEAEDIENFRFDFFKGNFRKMADHPIEFSSPPEDPIGQFCEKGSIERGKMSVSFEGIGEKTIGMAICLFNPIQDIEADRPWGLFPQNLPVLAISSSLAIRSSIGGWVLKRERTPPPLNGLTMNIWAVEGLASMGIRWAAIFQLPQSLCQGKRMAEMGSALIGQIFPGTGNRHLNQHGRNRGKDRKRGAQREYFHLRPLLHHSIGLHQTWLPSGPLRQAC